MLACPTLSPPPAPYYSSGRGSGRAGAGGNSGRRARIRAFMFMLEPSTSDPSVQRFAPLRARESTQTIDPHPRGSGRPRPDGAAARPANRSGELRMASETVRRPHCPCCPRCRLCARGPGGRRSRFCVRAAREGAARPPATARRLSRSGRSRAARRDPRAGMTARPRSRVAHARWYIRPDETSHRVC